VRSREELRGVSRGFRCEQEGSSVAALFMVMADGGQRCVSAASSRGGRETLYTR
jgi:hypothetical protein